MSASLNPGKTRSRLPAVSIPRPRLTVVPRPASTARRMPFVALVVGLLAAGLVGLLLLNTGMERGAYTVTALRTQVAALDVKQQALELQVAALAEPQAVAERALHLGMVQNSSPAFLDLRTGKVLGVSVPGYLGNRFDIGSAPGQTVGRLPKIPPVVAGVGISGSDLVIVPAVVHRHKGGDTTSTSPRNDR